MTTVLFVRAKDGSAVLGADCRISDGSSVSSDRYRKLTALDKLLFGFAGALGPFQQTQKLWELEEITTIDEAAVLRHGAGWSVILYDAKTGEAAALDADGALVRHDALICIGSGADIAYGFVRAHKQPRTVKEAKDIVAGAIKVASERDIATCQNFELLTASPRGRIRAL